MLFFLNRGVVWLRFILNVSGVSVAERVGCTLQMVKLFMALINGDQWLNGEIASSKMHPLLLLSKHS